MSGRWVSSNRRATLPKNWQQLRQAVRRRANNLCEADVHAPGCPGIGAECDHINDPLDHRMPNLQWLSVACHQAKTQKESQKAREKFSRKRQNRTHPGVGASP